MIRQAISCDVCGTEKRQTNHWFVAFEQAGELRLGGWTSRNRARPNSKHLCGQTCVHKLVDEYMAQIVASKPQRAVDDSIDDPIEYVEVAAQPTPQPARVAQKNPATSQPALRSAARARDEDSSDLRALDALSERTDSSLTTEYDFELDQECSARLITTPEPVVARHRPAAELPAAAPATTPSRPALVATPKSTDRSIIELPLAEEAPSFSSRKRRNEAWERERARELRAANNAPTSIASRLRLN